MTPDKEVTRNAVLGYFEVISKVNNQGIEESLAFMTDDVVWENPKSIKSGGIFKGKNAIREMLVGAINEVYEPNSMQQFNRKTIVEGAHAVCIFDTTAMTKRGRPYSQHFAIEFEVNAQGKISLIRENFDTLMFHNVVFAD